MPLSPPDPREPIHLRRIECRGFRRADGLWDIEGRLTDEKAYAFDTEYRGRMEPGDPVHSMAIRVTVDDRLTIRAIEAATDSAPFPVCGEVPPRFEALVGLRMGSGFTRRLTERLGGVHGCTHLVEMMRPIATTAFQTIMPIRARERAARGDADKGPPPVINTCHAFASDGPIVHRHWPDHYTGVEPIPMQPTAEAPFDPTSAGG